MWFSKRSSSVNRFWQSRATVLPDEDAPPAVQGTSTPTTAPPPVERTGNARGLGHGAVSNASEEEQQLKSRKNGFVKKAGQLVKKSTSRIKHAFMSCVGRDPGQMVPKSSTSECISTPHNHTHVDSVVQEPDFVSIPLQSDDIGHEYVEEHISPRTTTLTNDFTGVTTSGVDPSFEQYSPDQATEGDHVHVTEVAEGVREYQNVNEGIFEPAQLPMSINIDYQHLDNNAPMSTTFGRLESNGSESSCATVYMDSIELSNNNAQHSPWDLTHSIQDNSGEVMASQSQGPVVITSVAAVRESIQGLMQGGKAIEACDWTEVCQAIEATDALPGISVGRKLARGGMGVVYEGQLVQHGEQNDHQEVVIKVGSSSHVSSELLTNEVDIHIRVSGQARVVTLLDVRYFGDMTLIVLEKLQGPTLLQHLRCKTKMTFYETLNLIRALLEGIMKLHGIGVAHLDIEPENPMFKLGARAACIYY